MGEATDQPQPNPGAGDKKLKALKAANDNKLAFGIEEAATLLSIGKSTIWRWIHDEKIKTIKLGGRTLIRREELMRLLDEAA